MGGVTAWSGIANSNHFSTLKATISLEDEKVLGFPFTVV